jgi:acetyl-CoA decarbonylase/synthase complex subunit beta
MEGVIERRIHEFINYIQGFMHLNQRYDIHLRLSMASYNKGLNSFEYVGKVLIRLYKSELPIIEKIQVTFITDPERVKELYEEALKIYEARDARARGLRDEEVDVFYGCSLCQSFAPTHVCIITPQRFSNCGAISWFDGRAAARIDPKGPLFTVEKGECVDPVRGEYEGVNKMVKEKTGGTIKRVWLYTAFGYEHTSCGCFEAIAFYVPEVDGLGIIDRDFKGKAVNGLTFSAIADITAGGTQVDGFHGISIEYTRSPKFLQADGGWSRIVWVPKRVMERVKEFIPKDLVDKIPTEEDVSNVEELKDFLKRVRHPVVERWKELEEPEAVERPIEAPVVGPLPTVTTAIGGFKIIFENARIHADRVIIKRIRS